MAFLSQLRERHYGPLTVIWDHAPAHRGEAVRECLAAPGLGIQLVSLPDYSPDFNADKAIRGSVSEEATGNLCLEIWPETPILPKLLFSWRRLPM